MAHVRAQIRTMVLNALQAGDGLATTGENVFGDRAYPIPQENLPALRVFWSRETAQAGRMGTIHGYARQGTLMVVGYADGDGLDDTLDQIAAEVEPVIYRLDDFGGLTVGSADYTGAEFALAEGDSRTGHIAMSWELQYRTSAHDPENAI